MLVLLFRVRIVRATASCNKGPSVFVSEDSASEGMEGENLTLEYSLILSNIQPLGGHEKCEYPKFYQYVMLVSTIKVFDNREAIMN